ncbi:ABC transporter permease [Candidatus Bathyarchaeota archaeon]|nr:ABC transporter permease [Candidatus Bathyarchaeota archaeon]
MQIQKDTSCALGKTKTIDFKRRSYIKEMWKSYKKNKLAMLGLTIMVALLLLVVFAEYISPYQYAITMNLREKLQPPSAAHIFGTDGYGRDLFARCIHGLKISLLIGVVTSFLSMVIGVTVGMVVGYYGGITDQIVMRVMDVFAAIPTILLALCIVASFGPNLTNLMIALAISRIHSFTRIVRSSALSIVDQEFIEAARAGGTGDARIIFKHILPNAIGPVIVYTTMNIAYIILAAASLSFLGLGVNPPTPELGAIITEAKEFMRTSAYMMVFPGLLIIISSLSANLIGDGMRDILDPRLKS